MQVYEKMALATWRGADKFSDESKVAACTRKRNFWFHNVEQERAQNKPALLLQFVKHKSCVLLWQPQR